MVIIDVVIFRHPILLNYDILIISYNSIFMYFVYIIILGNCLPSPPQLPTTLPMPYLPLLFLLATTTFLHPLSHSFTIILFIIFVQPTTQPFTFIIIRVPIFTFITIYIFMCAPITIS